MDLTVRGLALKPNWIERFTESKNWARKLPYKLTQVPESNFQPEGQVTYWILIATESQLIKTKDVTKQQQLISWNQSVEPMTKRQNPGQ